MTRLRPSIGRRGTRGAHAHAGWVQVRTAKLEPRVFARIATGSGALLPGVCGCSLFGRDAASAGLTGPSWGVLGAGLIGLAAGCGQLGGVLRTVSGLAEATPSGCACATGWAVGPDSSPRRSRLAQWWSVPGQESAFTASRWPRGRGSPAVVSWIVCCSASALTSAPTRTTRAVIHSQSMRIATPARAP